MATYQVMCWQEIPSVVEAREAGIVRKVALGKRFQELIDLAAMKRGLAGSDAYLEQWGKSPRQEREGSAAEVAGAVAQELEARFDMLRDEVLAKSAAQIADFKSGKEKALMSIVGMVMKASAGKANPAQVNEIVKRKIAAQ